MAIADALCAAGLNLPATLTSVGHAYKLQSDAAERFHENLYAAGFEVIKRHDKGDD